MTFLSLALPGGSRSYKVSHQAKVAPTRTAIHAGALHRR
jgi:hypothetical protein